MGRPAVNRTSSFSREISSQELILPRLAQVVLTRTGDRQTAGQLLAIRLQIRPLGANRKALSRTKHLKISEHKQGR